MPRIKHPKYNYMGRIEYSFDNDFDKFNSKALRTTSLTGFVYGFKNQTTATQAFVRKHLKTLRRNGLTGTRKQVMKMVKLTRVK